MIYHLSSTTQKNKKKQLPGCYIKVEEISRTFHGVAKKFKDFSRLCEGTTRVAPRADDLLPSRRRDG